MTADNPNTCVICRDPECIYQRMPWLSKDKHFYLDDVEVTEEEFVRAERRAGFHNTLGHPEKPATAGFSTTVGGPRGSVRYIPQDDALDEVVDFMEADLD